jgi:hypothetical protein
MKLRLTQTKSGSRQGDEDSFLNAFHLCSADRRFVVEAVKVKKSMNNIETQLVSDGGSKFAGLPFRGFGADHDLAVLERDDVGGIGLVHEPSVKLRDPSVGNQDHVHLGKRT